MKKTTYIAVEGFVLKKREYKEVDEIITMFTKELGKIAIFAKGIKKITSKRLPHIQSGNYVSCILAKREEYFFLHETFLRSGLSSVKSSQDGVNSLYQYFFILDRLLPELEPEQELFSLVGEFCKNVAYMDSFSQKHMNEYIERTLMMLGHGVDNTLQYTVLQYTEKIMQEKLPLHVII